MRSPSRRLKMISLAGKVASLTQADIVTGSATVIQAMGAGRIAADAIHKKLTNMNAKQIS